MLIFETNLCILVTETPYINVGVNAIRIVESVSLDTLSC